MARSARLVRRIARSSVRRFRRGWRASLARTVRLTGAATAAYVVADVLLEKGSLHDSRPILATLTALLIVQVTLVGTVSDTLKRIASVMAGVSVAIVFSSFAAFNVVTLTVLIAASLTVGQILRLGPHLLEVPISAMLVLNLGGSETAAGGRIVETIIGAAVGLLVNLVFPPQLQKQSVGAAIEHFALELGELLDAVADEIVDELRPERAEQWLADARQLSASVADLDRRLAEGEQSRRLNPRALGQVDAGPDLRSGLNALEHSAVALRALYRSIADRAREQPDGEQVYGAEVRGILGVLLQDIAGAIRAFGALVQAESMLDVIAPGDEPGADVRPDHVQKALDDVREAQVRLTELLLVDPHDQPELWALHGSLLAAVDRVLRELDVERRQRDRARRLQEHAERPTAQLRAVVERPIWPRRIP